MQESVLTGYGVVGFMYPGRDPARGRTVAQGSPAAQGSPVAHKSHGAVRLSVRSPMLCPKHPQREETRARAALRESPGPLMAARRCDGRYIKQALSPHQGGGDMGRGAGGGEWYLRQC